MHLILKASSESEEKKISDQILIENLFMKAIAHHILFFEKTEGKIAILRQINPILHLEYDFNIYTKIQPHLKKIVLYESQSTDLDYNGIEVDNIKYYLKSLDDIISLDATAPSSLNNTGSGRMSSIPRIS